MTASRSFFCCERPLKSKTVNKYGIFIVTLAAGALAISFAACGPKAPEAVPSAAPSVALQTGDEPTKDLPPDLYPKMPQYPGSKVTRVGKPRREMREITFSTEATMPELVDYYKENLKKNGFHITSSLVMAARHTWSCDFQKEGRPATLVVYPTVPGESPMTIDLVYVMPSKNDPAMYEPIETFDVIGPGPVAAASNSNSNPSTKRN